ncbi:putative elongation factor TypA-like SVR3, chloroplastic [Tanacetum coccineum]|uniref:Elongation factor TypA-like SVR3, chloroplastic n=1 Tax=Tanacetum coccineum TaxID=301880 RepID=A0ABQ5BFR7_9ASTR
MYVAHTEYDEHKGKIAIGRLHARVLNRGMDFRIYASDDACRFGKVDKVFLFQKFFRAPAESVEAGDICVVCGIDSIQAWKRLFVVFIYKDVPTLLSDTNLDHMQLVNIRNQRSSMEDDAEVHRVVGLVVLLLMGCLAADFAAK